jgi:hypothetical protein
MQSIRVRVDIQRLCIPTAVATAKHETTKEDGFVRKAAQRDCSPTVSCYASIDAV